MTTHSTAKIAAELAGDSMKDPEGWLLRKIRAGLIPAHKVGRHYRMTDQDVAEALAILASPKPNTVEPEDKSDASRPLKLTRTSAKRLKAVSS